MSNMSYCRFQNTEGDFDDCISHLEDGGKPASKREASAAIRMMERAARWLLDCGIVSDVRWDGIDYHFEVLGTEEDDDDEDW